MSKFIFVVGGLVSGSGKGTTAASLGRLLKNRGLSVSFLKLNPYLNVDPGTMSPYQHGEIFVTEDGSEVDLDIGHYERFMETNLNANCNVSSGKLLSTVINNERLGKYVGSTVKIMPHFADETKNLILKQTETGVDIVIVEVGGSILDFETQIFLNAVGEFVSEQGDENAFVIDVDFLSYYDILDQEKLETIQQSFAILRKYELSPDAFVCRISDKISVSDDLKKRLKRRLLLNNENQVIINSDVDVIYSIPLNLQKEGLDELIVNKFKLTTQNSELDAWQKMVSNFSKNEQSIKICIIGKYTKVKDAYLSIVEALRHSCAYNEVNADIEIIDAEDVEEFGVEKYLKNVKAIIVPSGWGSRGFDGMIKTIEYARENKIPYLGIGLGMELAVVEFARNVLGLKTANTTEIDPNSDNPVVDIMLSQKKTVLQNKIMRLGAYNCVLDKDSISFKMYGTEFISERHRHKYEFNNNFYEVFEKNGMMFAGINPESKLTEIIELKKHPYFVCTIFEPQFKSYPNKPHPLFLGLINAAKGVR